MCSPSRSFLHIFLFTNIHNLSTSFFGSLSYVSLPLSLQPRSLSLFRHVNHPRLFILLTLSLSSATFTHLLSSVLDATSLSFSLPLSLSSPSKQSLFKHVLYPSLSLFLMFSLFSSCSHAHLLYFFSRSLSFSISPIISLSLSLQLCSRILLSSVVDATSLPFSHSRFLSSAPPPPQTHTLLSSVYLQLR